MRLRIRTFLAVLLSVMLFSASAVLAEEATTKIKFEGLGYINWHTNMTDSTDNAGGDKKNTFEIERVYLTWKASFSNGWGARVTTDLENTRQYESVSLVVDDDGDGDLEEGEVELSTKSKTKYALYLKYAYVEKKAEMGPAGLTFRLGMVGTPMIGFVDKLADQRWVHKNMIDDSKSILNGFSIDNSADMGASLSVKMMKMIEIEGAITNGEGYKDTDESEHSPSDEGKAYYARLTINPIKQLYVSGFYRREGLNTDEADDHEGYYGGGVAWSDDKLIMVGANYLVAFKKVAGEDVQGTSVTGKTDDLAYSIIDIWATLKLNSFVGMPLFLMARYGIGDTGLEEGKTTFMGAGLGYEFEEHVRFIAWYQQYDSEANDYSDNPNPAAQFAIKAEVKI